MEIVKEIKQGSQKLLQQTYKRFWETVKEKRAFTKSSSKFKKKFPKTVKNLKTKLWSEKDCHKDGKYLLVFQLQKTAQQGRRRRRATASSHFGLEDNSALNV